MPIKNIHKDCVYRVWERWEWHCCLVPCLTAKQQRQEQEQQQKWKWFMISKYSYPVWYFCVCTIYLVSNHPYLVFNKSLILKDKVWARLPLAPLEFVSAKLNLPLQEIETQHNFNCFIFKWHLNPPISWALPYQPIPSDFQIFFLRSGDYGKHLARLYAPHPTPLSNHTRWLMFGTFWMWHRRMLSLFMRDNINLWPF